MENNENSLDIVSVRLVRERSIMADDPIKTAEDAIRLIGRYFRDPGRTDKLLTLSTCMGDSSRRLVLQAVLLTENCDK